MLGIGKRIVASIIIAILILGTISMATPPTSGQSVVATIQVGVFPWRVAVNPVTNLVYVANQGIGGTGDTVSVIDGDPASASFNQVVATIPVGATPPTALFVAVNPQTNRVYVVNQSDRTVSVIHDPVITNVNIDIKQGSDPNAINPKSMGTIPIAILSTPDFNAPSEVDKTSLTFGRTGDEPSLKFCNNSAEDVNSDGLLDQVCHFNTQQTGFQAGDNEGILKGKTVTGIPIEGRDSVKVV